MTYGLAQHPAREDIWTADNNSIEQSWEADRFSASQEGPCIL